jgi:hypothetical protein
LSQKICASFKNSKIKYHSNKGNIGFTKNLYKAINLAKGKYIFILGDDDLLLEKDLLSRLYKTIKKYKYGYIRVKFIYHKAFREFFSIYLDKHIPKKERIITAKSSDFEIYNYIDKSIYSFISGIILLNTYDYRLKEIESSDLDLSNFWIKYIFKAVKSHGGYIDVDNTIVAQWPDYKDPVFYNVIDKKIPEERIWELYKDTIDLETSNAIVRNYVTLVIRNLPSIKYYSTTKNLFLFSKRLIELDNTKKYSGHLYFSFFIALLMPKSVWRFIRSIYQKRNRIKDKTMEKNISQLLTILK